MFRPFVFYINHIKKNKFKYFKSYIKKKSEKDINIVLYHLHIILNKIHKTELTKKQWSIILGPWLSALNNIYEHKKILLKVVLLISYNCLSDDVAAFRKIN